MRSSLLAKVGSWHLIRRHSRRSAGLSIPPQRSSARTVWRCAEPCDILQRSQCKAVTFVSVLTELCQSPAIISRPTISLIHQSRFPHASLFNITSHLNHLAPSPSDHPQRTVIEGRNRILTILARNNGARTVCAQTDTEVLSWGRTGEKITRAYPPRRPGESTVASSI
jgi:hypothetical protein